MGNRVRRLVRRALVVLVPATAAYYLLLGGEYSAFDLRDLGRARAEAVARVDSLQSAVDSLARRADSLARDTLAIERVARERYGFIREGERLYRFVPAEEAPEAPAGPEQEASAGVDGVAGRR